MRKDIIFGVMIALAIIAVVTLFSRCQPANPSLDDIEYNETRVVKITGCPHVRSMPIWTDEENQNSFGRVKEDGFTMEVTLYARIAKPIDQNNGDFFGFMVADIQNTPEGKAWFPSGIENDPDQIVWIHHDYVEIIF